MIQDAYTPTYSPRTNVRIVRDDLPLTLPDGTHLGVRIGWLVLVDGFPHGGRTYEYLEAVEHASRCENWDPQQRAAWFDQHAAA